LFGSTLGLASDTGPRFVLDTLFVVAEQRQRFTPTDPPKTDEVFRVCTVEPLAIGGCPASTPVRQRRPVEEERVNGSSSPVKERRWDNNPSG